MTVLTIAQEVADNVPVASPTVVLGSAADTPRLLRSQAQKSGKSLMRAHPWVILVKEHTFSTVASTEDYALPSDFDRMESHTAWDRTNFTQMVGGRSPQEWQFIKSSVLAQSVGIHKRFRIKPVTAAKRFFIDPIPDAVETLVFEYTSENWAKSSSGTEQNKWLADTDVGILEEYLMELGTLWRVLKRLGMAFADELAEYNSEVEKAWARDRVPPTLNMTNIPDPVLIDPIHNIPDTGFG